MRHPELPQVGRIVEVIRGRDRGLIGIVIGHVPDRYVLIADGHSRKAEKPKKKNILHIRPTPHEAAQVKVAIATAGKVTNAKLRFALRMYETGRTGLEMQIEEGDAPSGEG